MSGLNMFAGLLKGFSEGYDKQRNFDLKERHQTMLELAAKAKLGDKDAQKKLTEIKVQQEEVKLAELRNERFTPEMVRKFGVAGRGLIPFNVKENLPDGLPPVDSPEYGSEEVQGLIKEARYNHERGLPTTRRLIEEESYQVPQTNVYQGEIPPGALYNMGSKRVLDQSGNYKYEMDLSNPNTKKKLAELGYTQAKTATETQKPGLNQAKFDETAKHNRATESNAISKASTPKYSSYEKLSGSILGLKGVNDAMATQVRAQNQAEHLEALIHDNNFNLSAIPTEELAVGLNRLISGSNRVASERINAVVPQSMQGDWNKIAGYFTGTPKPLEQQKFVKVIYDLIQRQNRVSGAIIRRQRLEALGAGRSIREKFPEDWNNLLGTIKITNKEVDDQVGANPDLPVSAPGSIPGESKADKVRRLMNELKGKK